MCENALERIEINFRRTDMGYIISRIIGWVLWMALRDLEDEEEI